MKLHVPSPEEPIPPPLPSPKSPNRLNRFRIWRTRSSSSSDEMHDAEAYSSLTASSPHQQPGRLSSIMEVPSSITNTLIRSDYIDLYQSIVEHVSRYYHMTPCHQEGLRAKIATTTAGCHVPMRGMVHLVSDINTRAGALVLCIGWVILSRCLLLSSGMSNSPGSTFLPPEIVECFQSFSLEQLAKGVQMQNHAHGKF